MNQPAEGHMQNPESESTPRNNRIIVAPFDRDQYPEIVFEPYKFRESLDNFIKLYPEIFSVWNRLLPHHPVGF